MTEEIWSVESFTAQYSSQSTVWSYRSALLHFFSLVYPELKEIKGKQAQYKRLNELSIKYFSEERDIRNDIIAFKDSLSKSPAKTRLARFAAVFRFFEDNGQVFNRNFVRNITGKEKDAETDEHIPAAEEIVRILEYLPIQAKTVTLVLLSSGMRVGEIIQLNFDNLQLDMTPARITLPTLSVTN
jgi:integrase